VTQDIGDPFQANAMPNHLSGDRVPKDMRAPEWRRQLRSIEPALNGRLRGRRA